MRPRHHHVWRRQCPTCLKSRVNNYYLTVFACGPKPAPWGAFIVIDLSETGTRQSNYCYRLRLVHVDVDLVVGNETRGSPPAGRWP